MQQSVSGTVRDLGLSAPRTPYGLVMACRGRLVPAALSPDESGPRTGKCASVRALSAQSDGPTPRSLRLTAARARPDNEQRARAAAGWRTLAGRQSSGVCRGGRAGALGLDVPCRRPGLAGGVGSSAFRERSGRPGRWAAPDIPQNPTPDNFQRHRGSTSPSPEL
jgi:hypothetical protein